MRIWPDLCSPSQARSLLQTTSALRVALKLLTPVVGCMTLNMTTRMALADTAAGTVVISAAQTTPMLRRLQQEVEGLGFSVRIENRGFTERPPAELSTAGVVAAIEIVTTIPGFIALYVLEPKTARVIRQELPLEAPSDPTSTELVTTRAVELLRAARLEVGARTKPSLPAPPPAAASVAAPPKTKDQPIQPKPTTELQLGAGPGLSFVPNWRVSTNFGVTASYLGTRGFGWVGAIAGTITPARLTVADIGWVEAAPTNFRLGGLFHAFRQTSLGLRVSGGIEWSQTKFTGEVTGPYTGSSVYISTFAPWLAVGASVRCSSHLQLITQLGGSWAVPRTVLRVAGQELRAWGQPALSASIQLEWRAL